MNDKDTANLIVDLCPAHDLIREKVAATQPGRRPGQFFAMSSGEAFAALALRQALDGDLGVRVSACRAAEYLGGPIRNEFYQKSGLSHAWLLDQLWTEGPGRQ